MKYTPLECWKKDEISLAEFKGSSWFSNTSLETVIIKLRDLVRAFNPEQLKSHVVLTQEFINAVPLRGDMTEHSINKYKYELEFAPKAEVISGPIYARNHWQFYYLVVNEEIVYFYCPLGKKISKRQRSTLTKVCETALHRKMHSIKFIDHSGPKQNDSTSCGPMVACAIMETFKGTNMNEWSFDIKCVSDVRNLFVALLKEDFTAAAEAFLMYFKKTYRNRIEADKYNQEVDMDHIQVSGDFKQIQDIKRPSDDNLEEILSEDQMFIMDDDFAEQLSEEKGTLNCLIIT